VSWPRWWRRALAWGAGWYLDTSVRLALRRPGWRARGSEIRVALVPRAQRKECAQRVANALVLIARFDPPRSARIQRDLTAVLVWPLVIPGAHAQFLRRYAVCALDSAHVLKGNSVFIALWIVHEAAHARLDRFTDAERMARVERLCAEQELAFAARLPDSEPLQAWLRQAVAAAETTDWSPAGVEARGLEALRESGASRPTLAVLRRIFRMLRAG
jgi:hypothetical protein